MGAAALAAVGCCDLVSKLRLTPNSGETYLALPVWDEELSWLTHIRHWNACRVALVVGWIVHHSELLCCGGGSVVDVVRRKERGELSVVWVSRR